MNETLPMLAARWAPSALRRHSARVLLWLLLATVPALASAQLVVQITRGSSAPLPIAVVPFADNVGPATDVAAVVTADLERSGRFAVLARQDLLSSPAPGQPMLWADWRRLAVNHVLVGRVRTAGTSYTVDYELYSVTTGERLLGQSVAASFAGLRTGAHRVADAVYEKLLGVPGSFASRLAYVAVEGRAPQQKFRLVVADADGENAATVLTSAQPLMAPAFSPDGTKLAYVSFEGGRSAVWVQALRTGERQRVSARGGLNDAPAWSPDGTRLALAIASTDGNVDLWLLNLADNSLLRVTEDPAIDTEPAFSPDGQALYFTSDRGGRAQVYRASLAGGKPQRVTFEGGYNARPRVSADGSRIALVTSAAGGYRIGVQELTGGTPRVVTEGPNDESPAFAPNGQWLVFAARRGGRGVLATVAIDSGARTVLSTAAADIRSPTWGRLP
jgi:TolB protein